MSTQRQITLKQWQRRALKAEETVGLLQKIRAHESGLEMEMVRELSAARVALNEMRETLFWSDGQDPEDK